MDYSKPLDFFMGIKMFASARMDDRTTRVSTRVRQHTRVLLSLQHHTESQQAGRKEREEPRRKRIRLAVILLLCVSPFAA